MADYGRLTSHADVKSMISYTTYFVDERSGVDFTNHSRVVVLCYENLAVRHV